MNIKKHITLLRQQNNCQDPGLSSWGSSPHRFPLSPGGMGQGAPCSPAARSSNSSSWEAPGRIRAQRKVPETSLKFSSSVQKSGCLCDLHTLLLPTRLLRAQGSGVQGWGEVREVLRERERGAGIGGLGKVSQVQGDGSSRGRRMGMGAVRAKKGRASVASTRKDTLP